MYPGFLKIAEQEGNCDAAEYFKDVINAEKNHAAEFKAALEELEKGTLYSSNREIEWRCRVCGYIYKGVEPPELCPLCKHPTEHYDPVCCK